MATTLIEHTNCPVRVGVKEADRVVPGIHYAGPSGQVKYVVDFVQREVVTLEVESLCPTRRHDGDSGSPQALDQMTTEKAGAAGDEDAAKLQERARGVRGAARIHSLISLLTRGQSSTAFS